MGESLMGRLAKALISQMTEPVKIEVCRGSLTGCPKAVIDQKDLEMDIMDIMDQIGLMEELKHHLPEEDLLHPTLTISISGCVNGCSRPHIKDIGLEGIVKLGLNPEKCNQCGACIKVCQENAIRLQDGTCTINSQRCLSCGQCARACSTGALTIEQVGLQLMVGGRLGRRPQFGQPVANFLTRQQVVRKLRELFEKVVREHRSGHYVDEILHTVDSDNRMGMTGR